MSKPHAIRALEKRRAALKVEMGRLDMLRAKAAENVRHIDATLALLRDAKRCGAPCGPQRRWLFRRGELRRMILAIERERGEPLTPRDMARAIIARMNWDRDDGELFSLLTMKVRNARRLMPPCAASSLSKSG